VLCAFAVRCLDGGWWWGEGSFEFNCCVVVLWGFAKMGRFFRTESSCHVIMCYEGFIKVSCDFAMTV